MAVSTKEDGEYFVLIIVPDGLESILHCLRAPRHSIANARSIATVQLRLFSIATLVLIALLNGVAFAQSNDVALMKRVNRALRADNRLNGASAYTAAPGVIVLYGTVFDKHDRELAERVANGVRGVNQVDNMLRTKTGQWR
jgi:hypothetical protein